MFKFSFCLLVIITAAGYVALGQSPATDQKPKESAAVTKLMAYGKKEPGKVWRDEVTDERLFKLFDLADTKKAGVVTKEQLVAAAAKLEAEEPQGGRRTGGNNGPGGAGGPGGFGGGPGGGGFGGGGFGGGGRGGFGRPQVGVVMPSFVQEQLKLTDEQKQQMADLQKELDAKVDKILTADQKKQYQDMKDNAGRGGRGPGGQGGPGGPPGGPQDR